MIKDENDTHIRSYFELMLYSVELLLDDEQLRMDDVILPDNFNVVDDSDEFKNSTDRFLKRFASNHHHHHHQQHMDHHRRKQIAREFSFEMDDHDKLPEKVIEEMHQVLRFEQLLANVSISNLFLGFLI